MPPSEPTRPDPAELLARSHHDPADSSTPRGRLKIFFGMAPGVGKTYAMLAAAQRMASQGVDVVAGIIETHSRTETEQLLLGLDIIPKKRLQYAPAPATDAPHTTVSLAEFDVDAAIARRPDILLIDELAHTNAPGSTREKRWQDVLECLKAGVNVYTTLNVQHLESVSDVVAQITGVAASVRETVPDSVFDQADEVELIDLPTEVLHERLKAGKVYLSENAARAVDPADGFFRKGNLTALRELALRRTAAWVDSELRRYKQDRGIRAVWPAGERIVVAVSPSPMSGKLIRAAKRMAAGLHGDLIAVYVETPRTANLPAIDRERLAQNMQLARSLGATTATLASDDAALELIAFARSRNVSKIVVGKTERPRWREALFGSFIANLIRQSGDIDIYVVRGDDLSAPPTPAPDPIHAPAPATRPLTRDHLLHALPRFGLATAIIAACSGLALAFYEPPDLSEESLILLGGVVLASLWCGRAPGIFASILAVIAFNFFFTPPRFSLSIADPSYLLTFSVMLSVGLIVGTLAARTRDQTRRAWDRERQTAALYALSRELAAAQDARQVAAIATRHAHDLLTSPDTQGADVVLVVPSPRARAPSTSPPLDVLASAGSPDFFDERERSIAQWSLDHSKPAGLGTPRLPSAAGRYIPLVGTSGKLGILGIRPARDPALTDTTAPPALDTDHLALIDALSSQVASALERVSLSESQQSAKLEAERERLRSALLSSVSHDLRTPLASITGAATTLQQALPSSASASPTTPSSIDPATTAALLHTIVSESSRLSDIIANLVFATRLESGSVTLNREWTTVEEIVGVGLARHRQELAARPFHTRLPDDLPMIRVDNAMLPQVVHNLVENALRYTPPGTPISISASTSGPQLIIKVADEGPGLSNDESAKVFQRFYRGRASKDSTASSPSTGMGLGLSICEGIIRAHNGRIWAEPNTPRGVAFLFSLPIDFPQPTMPAELTASSPTPAPAGDAA